MKFVIYKITNKLTGENYIGQTSNYERRLQNHIARAQPARITPYSSRLHREIGAAGLQNFTFEVIATRETQAELDAAEIRYMAEYNSREPSGYNFLPGGKHVYDDVARAMFAERTRRLHQDPEFRARSYPKLKGRVPYNKGASMPQEQRDKLSLVHLQIVKKPGYVSPNLGATKTPTQLENIRAAAERREADRRANGEAHPNLGMKRTDAAKERMRAAKNPKPVYCETNGQTYPSARAAAIALKLQAGNVAACLRGRLKSTGGCRFRFAS